MREITPTSLAESEQKMLAIAALPPIKTPEEGRDRIKELNEILDAEMVAIKLLTSKCWEGINHESY